VTIPAVLSFALAGSRAGAFGELLISAELLSRGLHVFRAVNPDSPCDLLVLGPAGAVRVEVTKGRRTSPDAPLHEGGPRHERSRYDVLALWAEDGSIEYLTDHPDLMAVFSARPLTRPVAEAPGPRRCRCGGLLSPRKQICGDCLTSSRARWRLHDREVNQPLRRTRPLVPAPTACPCGASVPPRRGNTGRHRKWCDACRSTVSRETE